MRGIVEILESCVQGPGVCLQGSVLFLGHDYFLYLWGFIPGFLRMLLGIAPSSGSPVHLDEKPSRDQETISPTGPSNASRRGCLDWTV